jgi:hypothetical protein
MAAKTTTFTTISSISHPPLIKAFTAPNDPDLVNLPVTNALIGEFDNDLHLCGTIDVYFCVVM